MESLQQLPKLNCVKIGISTLPITPLLPTLPKDMTSPLPQMRYLALTTRGRYQPNMLLVFLSRMNALRKLNLDLAYSNLSDADLRYLIEKTSSFQGLTQFCIDLTYCSQINEESLCFLFTQMRKLERVRVTRLSFTQSATQKVITAKSMSRLGEALRSMAHLHTLSLFIGGQKIKRESYLVISSWIDKLNEIQNLRIVAEGCNNFTDKTFLQFTTGLTNLKHLRSLELRLESCQIHDESLQLLTEVLFRIPGLRSIQMRFPNYRYFTKGAIEKFKSNVYSMKPVKKKFVDYSYQRNRRMFAREWVILIVTIMIPVFVFSVIGAFFIYKYNLIP
jgi:hypothetical protein